MNASESFNFAAHVFSVNRGRASKLAYIDDQTVMTYGELEARARQIASLLLSKGVRRDERVLLLQHDSAEWPATFLGCLYGGVIPVAVNTLLTTADYAYMLEHSQAKAAFVSHALLPILQEAMASMSRPLDQVFVMGQELDAALAIHQSLDVSAATLANDHAFWLYSSGSTGRPKGVVHTHSNLRWTADLYGKAVLNLTEQDVCFSGPKLFFAYGLGNSLTFPLSVGATVVLMAGRATPEAIFKRWLGIGLPPGAKMVKPTVFFGAPTGYAAILASPALPTRNQVALRMCSSAGEALPGELARRFQQHFGCEVVDGIGSTEMLHIYISNRPGEVRYGTTGKPVDGYEIDLRSEDGTCADVNEIGDLYVNGPSAALMYWGDAQKTKETFAGGWVKTGDKYSRDSDGYYTYAGRSDDMLKVSGIYVSPFEVEATLMRHPAVLEAAVVGKTDVDGLVKTKAFVVLKEGHTASEEALKAFVKEHLAPYKYPRFIEFAEHLPKTATGKIQRFRLRQLDSNNGG